MEHSNQEVLVLPVLVAGPVDVGRLIREVESLNEFMDQASIRTPGTPVKMPKTSSLLDEMIALNKLNMLKEEDRQRLHGFLKSVRDEAPLLHMSFSADPAPTFIKKLMTWLRKEVHPMVLLQIGLQPNIGAGCVVRSTNTVIDLSLKQHFSKQRDVLMQALHGTPEEQPAQSTATTSSQTPPAQPQPTATPTTQEVAQA